MKNIFKRILSLLMVLVMVGSMLPAVYADDAASNSDSAPLTDEDYAIVNDVFAQIDAMEDAPAKKSATRTQLTDAAAKIVMASENYVEGSLERNGNSFTWWTDEGIRCIYNPYMREKYANMRAPENAESAGIYNEPKATRGGWPSGNQVYLIAPYYGIDDTFTDQYKNEAKSIASAIGDTDGYTLYSGTSVTVDKVAEAISNGAVVIFDSHGTTDYDGSYVCDDPDGYAVYDYVSEANYSYLCLTNKTGLTTEDYNDGATYFTDSDGYMCACVNGAAIANHMTSNSPAGLLWMAICLGMATDTMCEPMREKGVEVVYGYSQSVTFAGDYCFEETFWDNMIAGNDVATSIAAMKKKWGNWDWSEAIAANYGYSGSGYTLSEARQYRSAFPIVVSDEDTHPGQRDSGTNYGACSEQTVKSTYTLYSQYNVTAQSNNTAWGTVSASGSTITATPATGYFAQGYTVTSGTATVTQNGNTFSVSASSDCVVQINFAAKTAVTVNFSGANVSGQTGYAGDSMTLPTAEAPEGYKFLGWMTAPLSKDTTEKPTYYTDSFIPTANTTLYALYSYVDENSGSGTGDYVKVTETLADWSGEYVIVYEESGYIFDGSLSTFDAVNNYKAVTITDSTIAAAEADPYKFTIVAVDSGYSIQGTSGNYIGNASNSNDLTTGTSALANTISLEASGNANIIGSGGAYLRFNATSGQNRFRYYKSSSYSNQKAIALYVKDGSAGTTYYTTTLCEHTNTTDVAAVAATCTETGFTAGTQCADCGSFVTGHEVVAALGHSYDAGVVTTAPTCTVAGVKTYTCSACGESYTEAVAATGHSLGEGTVTTAATCTVDGVMTYTCGTCGTTTTEAIPATGHNYGEGVVTTAATCTADGVKTYTCSACGESKIEAIPAAGHSYTDGACSVCGEAEPQVTTIGYYIAANRNDNYFYMTSDLGTATTKRYQAVDTESNEIPDVITDPQDGYVFNLIDNGDNTYSLQAVGVDGDNYLGWTSGNSGILVAEASALKLTVDIADGVYSIHFTGDAERYLSLNATAGNNYFAWYKSGQISNLILIPVEAVATEPEVTEPEATEPEVTEPEVTEPEVTEPEVTEPEVTEPEATEPEASEPGSVTTLQYVFDEYPAGAANAVGEVHELDDVVTMTVNNGYLTDTLRLYANSGNAVFESTKVIESIIIKAGHKASTLTVYGSVDGVNWTSVQVITTTITQTDYEVQMPEGSAYTYLKLEAGTAQVRVQEMTINVQEPIVCAHTNTTEVAAVAATCTETGFTAGVYCNDCETYTSGHEEIAALGHSYDEGTVTTAATCTADGVKTYTCSACGESKTEAIPATGHSYNAVVTDPTATEQGYTTYTCSVCGDSYVGDYVDALGETYTVSFDVPEGVPAIADKLCGKAGITLPNAGVPDGTYDYVFAGWVTTAVDNTQEASEILEAGSTYTATSDTTLYALYTYVVDTGEYKYKKVTEAPADWSGEYLIVYEADETTGYIFDGTLAELDVTNNYKAVTITNSEISAEEGGGYEFIIAKGDDGYAVQAANGNYLYRAATSNGLNEGSTPYYHTITMESFASVKIASSYGPYLNFNAASDQMRFRYFASGQKPIKLYEKSSSTTCYTTVIKEETNEVESWNVSLGDNIGVNFVMNVAETDVVSFTVAGKTVTAAQDGNTYAINLAAAQMTDEIKIAVNGVDLDVSYSVRKYANKVLANEQFSDCHELVKAMLVYGAASQSYFGYNVAAMADAGITCTQVDPTGEYKLIPEGSVAGVSLHGATLLYNNKIAVRFYFTAESLEGLTFTVGETEVEPKAKGDKYYIDIAGINPKQLGDNVTVVVSNGTDSLSVSYSPMAYIVRMFSKPEADSATKTLVKALYNYYQAAVAYTPA